ncbi:TetR/AcrR family transcriptional regulator [Streptomyces sp. NBC_00448]|uniref:TetR/AcrR family transcriptional regulator n=1 Tax=Streptomyces sp. NBC_00448 TaxID=2903652 RepID=UPI002E1D471B
MPETRPLRADAQRNRDRLLEVAREAFATEGIAVPLDVIARRAGVGPGTLYRHFPTKEALFEAVVHDRLHQLIHRARELGSADGDFGGDPGTALAAFLDHLLRESAPKQDLVDALVGSGVDIQDAVMATAAVLREEIAGLLARAQAAGTVRADLTAADLMALVSAFLHAMRPRSATPADPARLLSVLLDGLAPKPPVSEPVGDADS